MVLKKGEIKKSLGDFYEPKNIAILITLIGITDLVMNSLLPNFPFILSFFIGITIRIILRDIID